MNKTKLLAIGLSALVCLVMLAPSVLAQSTPINAELEDIVGGTNVPGAGTQGEDSAIAIIGSIINIAVGFLGLILFVYILWGGFLYLTSGGDPEKTKKGKNKILYAVIGLLIVMSAYAIAQYVISKLSTAVDAGV
jgi:hypothetical protein